MANKKFLFPAAIGATLNHHGIFKTLSLGIIVLLASTFTGCDDGNLGGEPRYELSYRFEYEDNLDAYEKFFDSSERTFTFNVYDTHDELIYKFTTFGLSEQLFDKFKDGILLDPDTPLTLEILRQYAHYYVQDFTNIMPVYHPVPGVEYHPLDWVTVKNIQTPGNPVTFQITISENTTGKLRGFSIQIQGEKWENSVTTPFGELLVLQLPAEDKTVSQPSHATSDTSTEHSSTTDDHSLL